MSGAHNVDDLMEALQRLRSLLAPALMRTLLDVDLTTAQLHALHAIWRRGRVNGRQLATDLGVTPAAVAGLVERLEERAYVERVRDRADRRIWWSQLTPAGASVFERLLDVPRSRLGPAVHGLSAGDLAALTRLLHRVADGLEVSDD